MCSMFTIKIRRGPLYPFFYRISLTRRISNFSQILQYSQFSQFSQKPQFSSGPSQLLLLQVFADSTNFPIFADFTVFDGPEGSQFSCDFSQSSCDFSQFSCDFHSSVVIFTVQL